MKNWIFVLLLLFLFSLSCFYNKREKLADNSEFYSVLNGIITNEFPNASVVLSSTIPISNKTLLSDSLGRMSPPQFDTIFYPKAAFEMLVDSELLKEKEARFMFDRIPQLSTVVIDSAMIDLPVVSKNNGSLCYLMVGTSLFNSNRTKCLIDIYLFCRGEYRRGTTYLVSKVDDKWMIFLEISSYVS